MKVFAAGIITETNTFSPTPTGLADFRILRAADVDSPRFADEPAFTAIKREAEQQGFEFAFALCAFAQPSGTTLRGTYEALREELLDSLRSHMPVDIVALPLHGAMVADGYDDCEADIVRHVREIVGSEVPIGVELDLHCHISQELIDLADIVITYKEYPHTDTGDRAADLMRLLFAMHRGEIDPTMALFDCRMEGMYPTSAEPMRSFVDAMMAAEGKDGLLSLSLGHGFPWGDVPDLGCRMVAVTDGDAALAEHLAREWGMRFHELRREVTLNPLSLDDALDRALAAAGPAAGRGPVVVADQSDNPGGGAPSDSTFALRALLERGAKDVALALMWDPIVVRTATVAGKGARLKLRLGGKMGPASGDPLDVEAVVTRVEKDLHQTWSTAQATGRFKCGAAVALKIAGVDVIVNDDRGQVFGPDVFTNMGIAIADKQALIVKSTQHFYAGFAPIASEVLYMAAPGAVAPLMTQIPLVRADLNKYPWVENPFQE